MIITQPYSGHYFQGLWYRYDDRTEDWIEAPVIIRFRPHDFSSRDLGTGIREDTNQQDLRGFGLEKYSMVIQVVNSYKFSTKDRFKDLTDNKTYYIKKIGKGYDSINSVANLMFPGLDSRPQILYLGDISE